MLILISILSILLLFFTYFCIKFALIIIKTQEDLEYALDEIDKKYNRITEILDIPVFFDSPEIRRLLLEIKDIKRVILEVSARLSKINNKEIQQEIEDIDS